MINKKMIAVASALVLAFTVSACSNNSASGKVDYTDTIVDNTTQDYSPTPEELYLSNLHSQGNVYVEGNTDAALLKLGNSVCNVYDAGYTTEQIVEAIIADAGLTSSEQYKFAGMIIGAAVKNLCPEYYQDALGYLQQ